ncbi:MULTISPECIES: MarR family winged helix-turn-helix transcriptional regulator [Niallia]|jgi:MarR family transcriptional regulator, organic hydroperoxide resistance regulator|uniref:MarR family winged helix-turn-helix transcriptional regulator n=1 Tax=Niallia TaxID=2837506 RepID=UPI0014904CED|nr:MarR family transcriptional regulator [Niallia circulans]NRG28688.1 MarR family transcriptional regulator [Niallia circulans]QJX60495.1 MarR family transcriptional regulator [Niallia circulans]
MELNNCMNFLLSVSQNKVFKYFSKLLEEYGVTPAQYGVLNCLWKEGQLSPKQIGEMVYLEAPTVSGILDKMQKAGLIERSVDPNNRRNVLVTVTSKSNSIKENIESATINLNTMVLQNLSDDEQNVLKKALETIIKSDF